MTFSNWFLRITQFIVAILFILTIAPTTAQADESVKLPFVAQMNKYADKGYSALWGYTDPNGREYAILGARHGTSIVDITDSQLKEVGFIPGPNGIWRELKAHKGFAYVVNETGGGMQIIDLRELPTKVSLAATYTGFQTAHTIFIDEGRDLLFVEGNGSEVVRILDIADPLAPKQISSFGVECHDMHVQNNIAYVAEGWHGTWSMYDVSNPAMPKFIVRVEIPDGGYVHNTSVTMDNKYVFSTEEVPEGKTVKVWDISNVADIKMVAEYLGPNNLAHNVHIKGNYAYIAHYGAELRVLDIANPMKPVEVGFYSHREQIPSGYQGAWEVYPFFKSGKIIYSDISDGLFVVQFDKGREE
jgi:choice-of-anchor B domain-containing protein